MLFWHHILTTVYIFHHWHHLACSKGPRCTYLLKNCWYSVKQEASVFASNIHDTRGSDMGLVWDWNAMSWRLVPFLIFKTQTASSMQATNHWHTVVKWEWEWDWCGIQFLTTRLDPPNIQCFFDVKCCCLIQTRILKTHLVSLIPKTHFETGTILIQYRVKSICLHMTHCLS